MGLFVNDVVEVSFQGTVNGQRCLTTRPYAVTVADPGTTQVQDLQNIASQFAANVAGSASNLYLACCGANYVLGSIRAQKISPDRSAFALVGVGRAGTFGGQCEAQNLAGTIIYRTNSAGRNQIALTHMPGVSNTAFSGGELDPLYSGALDTLALFFRSGQLFPPTSLELLPVIYHRPLVGAGTFDFITSSTAQDGLRTMRRRTVRVGI